MGKRRKILWALLLCQILFIPGVCLGDETEIFSSAVDPDALIVLDLSYSMRWDPAGNNCSSPGCSRLEMAKAAIKTILDDNGDGTIDGKDEDSLRVRIGYMRFYSCSVDDTGGSWATGCNSLITAIPNTERPFSSPSRYSDIWSKVNAESANGSTPLASALNEARLYLDSHKNNDPGKSCRQKFVILVTDGNDTLACNGNGTETQPDMYKRRKSTVAKAKALADAGYRIFVVGFGANMPNELKNTLNWAAYYGGTENLSATKSGNTGAIPPSVNPCSEDSSNDPGNATLSGYAFMAANAAELSAALKGALRIISDSRTSFAASSVAASRVTSENFLYEASFQPVNNDPFWLGHLRKYSVNADGSIGNVLWDAGGLLQTKDPSTRQMFTYLSGVVTSFASGTFSAPGQAKKYLDVQTGEEAKAIVGYIRGESSSNRDNWKLGDILHSNPITIGSPSAYFSDAHSPQAFIDFRSYYRTRETIIVMGANDAQFRAIQASDGNEKWSFIPPNFLPKLKYLTHSTHPTNLQHTYFVDGPTTVADVWLGPGDGTTKSASDWHTLLVFGEGKGVRDSSNKAGFLWSSSSSCDSGFNKAYTPTYQYYCGYYAFDVTDTSASQPVFKWFLNFPSGGPQTQQYLDEPWSRMAIGRVIIGGNEKWVGFIGGGYNNDNDANKGKGFFVVDLSSGAVLWSFTRGNADTTTTSTVMTYSVPASPAIVDTDNDGFIDTAYVGDLGGNMWRFKFCTQTDASACHTGNWSGGLLFQASTGFIQPIYTTATVARGSIWVFWGTGNKENPTGTSGADHFFALQDNDRTTTYAIGNFQDLTTPGTIYSGAQPGWYITLGGTGEKVISDPTVFGGIVLFSTYTPSTSRSDPCAKTGTGKLYAIAMMRLAIGGYKFDPGAGVLSFPTSPSSTAGGARSVTLGSGIAKSPIISQKPVPGGSTDLYVSLSGGGGQDTKMISSEQLGSTPLTQRLTQTSPSSHLLHWKDGRIQ